jgi:DNA-binding XRE family transcriptional regulator
MSDVDKYRERYLQAIRLEMAERNIELQKDIAPLINTTEQTLSAIASGRQNPTVQHGIDLCRKCGYSANWLFLGKGERLIKHQDTISDLAQLLRKRK